MKSEAEELVAAWRDYDSRYPTDAPAQRVALAGLSALTASADLDAIRDAARRSGSPRLAGLARDRSQWEQVIRAFQLHRGLLLPPGAMAGAEARDAAAVSVARKLVGHLLTGTGQTQPKLTARQTAQTRFAFAIVAGRELDEARSKGWKGIVMSGPWLALEMGAGSPQTGKSTLDRLCALGWLTKAHRAKGGRAFVYKVRNLPVHLANQYDRAQTVNALTTGTRGVDLLADLILDVRAPAWAHGDDAPGSGVWAYAIEQTGQVDLGLSRVARGHARKWLDEHSLGIDDLPVWIAEHSGSGSDAQLAKEQAEAARDAKAAELVSMTEKHRARVRMAGEVLRAAARAAHEKPGKRKAVQHLVPSNRATLDELMAWTKKLLAVVVKQTPDARVRAALAPQIAKQLSLALTAADHPKARADSVAAQVENFLLKSASRGPDKVKEAA
ncbi:hypothetical protein [Pseudoclavibacter helvolus]|uniref:hypothetical protein n=1 Tax=Pseudoclavibacter helvolus TaxID=255205 RepID=UPI003C712E54